jgi:hypothetical protein
MKKIKTKKNVIKSLIALAVNNFVIGFILFLIFFNLFSQLNISSILFNYVTFLLVVFFTGNWILPILFIISKYQQAKNHRGNEMKRTSILLISLLSLIGFSSCAHMTSSDEVKIYFKNWNYLRRHSLSEVDVRQNHDIFIHITDKGEISRIKNILTLDLKVAEEKSNNVEMVIDFISNGLILETYILNKFAFFRKGDKLIFRTPEMLHQKYTFFE